MDVGAVNAHCYDHQWPIWGPSSSTSWATTQQSGDTSLSCSSPPPRIYQGLGAEEIGQVGPGKGGKGGFGKGGPQKGGYPGKGFQGKGGMKGGWNSGFPLPPGGKKGGFKGGEMSKGKGEG